MAHFWGSVKGSRSEVSRCGTKSGGMAATIAGWQGAVQVEVWHSAVSGQDEVCVQLVPWQGSGGSSRVLFRGKLESKEVQA